MTLYEASRRFGISEQKLRDYESYGMLHCHKKAGSLEYSEEELESLFQFHFLSEAGMDMKCLKELIFSGKQEDSKEKRVRILRKMRFEILDDIHKKQQCLDSVDFLISQIRQEGVKIK